MRASMRRANVMTMNMQKKHMASRTPHQRKPAQFTTRRTFRIDPELDERFRKAAILDGRNFDSALRWAIQEYCISIEDRHDRR